MTRKEFEERTGITNFTDEYYHDIIEEGYYRTALGEDAYCAAVAPMVNNPLLEDWVSRMKNSSALIDIYIRERRDDSELMLAIAEQIRYTAEGQAIALEARASDRMGRKEMILYKVTKSLGMTADDMNYIKENLR